MIPMIHHDQTPRSSHPTPYGTAHQRLQSTVTALGFLLTSTLCLTPAFLSAQQYGLEVEVVNEDIGVLVGALGTTDLTGYTCYRAYITMENEDDFLSSISGYSNTPTYITTTTDFYQAALGGATPNGINSLLFTVYPDLEFDSWVTIGLEGVPNFAAGEFNVSTTQSSGNPWTTEFDPGGGVAGASIAFDDAIGGAWYALNGDANGVAGADLKVLAGQFTTTGDLSLTFHTQIFINGNGLNEVPGADGAGRPTYHWPPSDVEGCTDVFACNYDMYATISDAGSCTFPIDLYGLDYVDCQGNCISDLNDDGVCDEEEVDGCIYEDACNYDPAATEDDGSCDYITCAGCMDDMACNYDDEATIDDVEACVYPIDLWGSSAYDCDGNCTCASGGSTGGTGDFDLVVETYAENIGIVGTTDLTGYNTYRLYAKLSSPEDFLTAVYGDTEFPTRIQAGNNFYQSPLGGLNNETYNPILFGGFPDLEFDSFVTIGMDAPSNSNDGEAPINSVGDPTNNWIPAFEPGGGMPGSDIIIDTQTGGSWFPLFPDANAYAGPDSLVLLGQFTAEQALYGEVSLAVFLDGNPDNDTIFTLPIPTLGGSGEIVEGAGCTDPDAANYCSCASSDDGSCIYPMGCTDPEACNYDMDATVDDGSCEYLSCAGCTEEEACNFDETATIDDASCVYPMDLYGSDLYDCDGNCLFSEALNSGSEPGEYGLRVKVVNEDIGVLAGALGVVDLTGYTTYRAYITMENEDDFLSSISGDVSHPTYITTTTDFYHSFLGGATPDGINSLLFPVYPDLEFDSWVSIGLEGAPNAAAGEANVSTVQSSINPWTTEFDPGGGVAGTSIAIDDVIGGAWFALGGDANGVAGADLQVLAGQFTTTGDLSLQFYTQIFVNGEGADAGLLTFEWSNTSAGEAPGCTDEEACNFVECAIQDDGSCAYPEDLYGAPHFDCEGNCLNDADGDGICDEDEPCTDPSACDYEGGEPELPPYYLQLDTFAVHTDGALAGMTTYRLYLRCENDADFVSAVAGYTDFPTQILTTTSFYQNELGGPTPNGIYPLLFGTFPDLAFDSWVTIGLEQTPDANVGEAPINTVQGTEYPWLSNFDPGFGAPGGSIVMEDAVGGSWFSLIGDVNGYAGQHPDQKVLLAQLTTDGVLSGELYIQVFLEGNGSDITYVNLEIGGSNILADEDCTYPSDIYGVDYLDCDGNCLNDTDEDGICDEDEVPGCTDETSCNFNPDATDDDGSCSYFELNVETVPASCAAEEDGQLTLNISGGITPYALSIVGLPNLNLYDSTFTFEGVPAGTYSVQVTEAAGCSTPVFIVEVEEPDPLELYSEWYGGCAAPEGSAIDFYAEGGTPPYVFEANGDTVLTFVDGVNGTDFGSGFMGTLPPGTWSLRVTDASDCVAEGEGLTIQACEGCTDEGACNFDPTALLADGSCTYPEFDYLDCDGNCINDADGDGVCDEIEVPGCTWPFACNYDPEATDEDGSCFMASVFFDCEGNCSLDLNNNGVCDLFEDLTNGTNFCGDGTVWDPELGTCVGYDGCPSDINEDGYIGIPDLLDLLSDFAAFCE